MLRRIKSIKNKTKCQAPSPTEGTLGEKRAVWNPHGHSNMLTQGEGQHPKGPLSQEWSGKDSIAPYLEEAEIGPYSLGFGGRDNFGVTLKSHIGTHVSPQGLAQTSVVNPQDHCHPEPKLRGTPRRKTQHTQKAGA